MAAKVATMRTRLQQVVIRSFGLTLALCGLIQLSGAEFELSECQAEVTKEASQLSFGGFIDTYLSIDSDTPTPATKLYLTQPSRDRELNLNLAYVDAVLTTDNVRGRVALQAATSVNTNYSAEPEKYLCHVQEAVVGVKLTDKLWLDGGTYLSHIGLESFISRDNWGYTRLLAREFSPYYESGAKLSYAHSPEWNFQFHLLNGWQNTSDFSGRGAIGTQAAWTPSKTWSVTSNSFIGKEPEGARLFHNFTAKVAHSETVESAVTFDVGFQDRAQGDYDHWFTWAYLTKYAITPVVDIVARVEQFMDRNQVRITPPNSEHFSAIGGSLGTNVTII